MVSQNDGSGPEEPHASDQALHHTAYVCKRCPGLLRNEDEECCPDSNKVCGIRTCRHAGSLGREDGAMFYLKVYRNPGAATCTPYTVYMVNG